MPNLDDAKRREAERIARQKKEYEEQLKRYEEQRTFLDSMLDKASEAKDFVYRNRNKDVQNKQIMEEAKRRRSQ